MATPQPREVEPAGGARTLLRAALPSIPVVSGLPGVRKAGVSGFSGLTLTRPPVTLRREDVDRYAAVCGFPTKDTVPLPYPHLPAFGLQMAILSDPAFPDPAIGTVHVENSITAHRPISIGETLDLTVSVGAPVAHPKGRVWEFVTQARVDGEVVWEETSSYLRRGRGEDGAKFGLDLPPVEPGGVVWRLPADLGRRYAAVSGDHNPIHLWPLSARALGFKRQIAHGMWTKARCIAALENRLPDRVRVDVAFKKPVFLPGDVRFGTAATSDGFGLSLTSARDGSPHLLGQIAAS